MFALAFLLLPLALGSTQELTIDDYVVKIQNGTLNQVLGTGKVSNLLNLSGLGLRNIDKNVFDNLESVTTLNLGNNSLKSFPEFVFANLTKLEHLSLADNEISRFENVFVGLNALKTLNLSNNPLRHLAKSYFFGLTKDCDITTRGLRLSSLSTVLFENPFLRDEVNLEDDEKETKEIRNLDEDVPNEENHMRNAVGAEDDNEELSKDLKIKICIVNGSVELLEVLKNNEEIGNDCKNVNIERLQRKLSFRQFGIVNFAKGWYKLKELPINSLDFTENDIGSVTSELLNDLPSSVKYVSLAENKIVTLKKDVIENEDLRLLNFKNNFIETIEDGALEKTKLSGLFLIGNRLKDTKFVATLPATITEMILSQNQITTINEDSFGKLDKLVYLNIVNNNVTTLKNRSLAGLASLQVLLLAKNGLKNIEKDSFQDLKSLRTLYLYRNEISNLESFLFAGLDNLKDLNLAWNKLPKVTEKTFEGLPDNLRELHLDFNEIETIESKSFVKVPKFSLSLDGNRIESIEKESFDLPSLRELHLKNNSLSELNGDLFAGLGRLRRLSVASNDIKTIKKGTARYLTRLRVLDLSENPLKRLENGVLFGLPKSRGSYIHLTETPIEIIQGGLFDDV